jgi:hypothetical protein
MHETTKAAKALNKASNWDKGVVKSSEIALIFK